MTKDQINFIKAAFGVAAGQPFPNDINYEIDMGEGFSAKGISAATAADGYEAKWNDGQEIVSLRRKIKPNPGLNVQKLQSDMPVEVFEYVNIKGFKFERMTDAQFALLAMV